MKASKTCPKCSSTEIYTDRGITKGGDRSWLGISSWSKLFLDVYICSDCGYLEEYVTDEDLRDAKKRSKLMEHWRKA